jgi:hypothetical protein
MTPADPGAQLDHEADACPKLGNRAREKTAHRSVWIPKPCELRWAYPPSPFLGPDRDADRMAHRPTERDQLAREARRLAAQGLTARDVAAALRLSDAAVVALLEVDHARE